MTRQLAGINEIEKLTDELTLMGGNPIEISKITREFEFSQATLKLAVEKVMEAGSNSKLYDSAMECKRILEYEILILNKSALRL